MNRTFSKLVLPGFLVFTVLLTATASGQVTFSDFSDVTGLARNGSAGQATNMNGQKVLRLTIDGQAHESGTAWSILDPQSPHPQSVSNGFTTVFQFQLTHAGNPADGIAFVIQNSAGQGFGTAARGGSGGAIGYGVPDPGDNGTAIPNSLAVEFDTYQNAWDPDANHIAVQSCGTDPNTQHHDAICPSSGLPAELGIVTSAGLNGILLADGNVHTATIDYDGNQNILRVFLDNAGSPVLTVNVSLSNLLTLNDGAAWVGFTGATGALTENNDILNWTFTPATTTTTITQTLTQGGGTQTTNYVFGSYNHKLQYTNADPDVVTVTAIPIGRSDFAPRLQGTPYGGDQCAIYEGTGGLCVEFEVTCNLDGGSCADLQYDLFNNFNTDETITGPCMLKAPIGTSDWTNIIEDFTQTRNDPGSHSSTKNFSDFILVEGPNGQGCTAPPTISITSPADGSFWPAGGGVPMEFSCTPDPTAPNVTTSCTGTVVGPGLNQNVNSGDIVTFSGTGPATLTVNATDSVLNTRSDSSNFTIGQAPLILSGNSAVFTVGTFGSFTVMTSGFPASTVSGASLPAWLSVVSNGDGTATLSGTPPAGSGGVYGITLTAHNGVNPDAVQGFTLTVNQPPAITSAASATFTVGTPGSFIVTATGFPVPALTESGALPAGFSFADNHDGTATLGGTPIANGIFPITFTASNGVGSDALQSFTLTVNGPTVSISPSSINFGTVYQFSLLVKTVTISNTGTSTLSINSISITDNTSDADDYTLLSFCGSSLSVGNSCKVYVVFWADDLGTRIATLNIADNALGSPQQVSLTGNVIKKGK